MSINRCPYCEHLNQEGAKFCSACGGALHLAPCPGCGAVNDVTAAACHQCRKELRWGRKEEPFAPPADQATAPDQTAAPGQAAAPVPASPVSPSPVAASGLARAIIGTAVVVVVMAFIGYYYVQRSLEEDLAMPPAKSETSQSAPANTGVIGRGATPAPEARKDERKAESASAPPQPAVKAPQVSSTVPAKQPRAVVPAQTQEARTDTPRPQSAGKAPSRAQACTPASAALGLCVLKPVQKGGKAASIQAAATRDQATDAVSADGPEPARAASCTDAVAALGLCSPKPSPQKE